MKESPHQAEFDEKYITSAEICSKFKIAKPTLMNLRGRGILAMPIVLLKGKAHIWVRSETLPQLTDYFKNRDLKR